MPLIHIFDQNELTAMVNMLSFLTKKKLSEEKVANVFVNSTLTLVEDTFEDVAMLINGDPEFKASPQISPLDSSRFLLVVLAGNIKYIPDYFSDYQDVRLIDKIYSKCAQALGVEKDKLKQTVSRYQSYMSRVNHPSKNTLYAMSKGVFWKYNLNDFQQDYFKDRRSPNPIFLKRLDEIMSGYLFDWEPLLEKYRVTES